CRVAATPYPAYKWHWTHHCTGSVGPASAAPPGDAHRHGAAFMPGGGSRLARPTNGTGPTIALDP
ncbi:hypothetical protein, partial [Klebsiella pneumoniae]|uniref:hypothetical protein n=1 Tax=Klebsiella pneumoniae TaxID=573 RepID=UPI001C7CC5FE